MKKPLVKWLFDFNPTWMADTTWAYQVANAVILQAPLLVYVAHPGDILANPAAGVLRYSQAWDETAALPVSQIGEVAAFARRKGDTWFLAVSNGPVARVVRVDLSFLGAGTYVATLIRDTGEASAVKIEHMTAQASDPLYVDLRFRRRIRGEVRAVTSVASPGHKLRFGAAISTPTGSAPWSAPAWSPRQPFPPAKDRGDYRLAQMATGFRSSGRDPLL